MEDLNSISLFEKLQHDSEELRAFAALSSETKIEIMKAMGAVIGNGVVIEKNSLVIGKHLAIRENCTFKSGTIVLGNSIAIGPNCYFESNSRWSCNYINIERSFYCAEETRVGWGGEWGRQSTLEIGHNSFLGEQAMLNPGNGLTIGSEVAIGAGAKVYTHSFWNSILEGYSAIHAPVKIGNSIQIGANAVILPDSHIEDKVVVSANSLVNGHIRTGAIVAGVPGRAFSRRKEIVEDEISEEAKILLLTTLMETFCRDHELDFNQDSDRWSIKTKLGTISNDVELNPNIFVTLKTFKSNPPPVATTFDLESRMIYGETGNLTDLLREFLRKRGVRFIHDEWRYTFKDLDL